MNILGIETSCDETAAAVVKDGSIVFSNTIVSSLKEHEKFGGVIPEIASRRQLEYINDVVSTALKKAKLGLDDIDSIAVTNTPGLIGSLLVGVSFAKALAFASQKPLVLVDHIKAHIYANYLTCPEAKTTLAQKKKELPFPAIGLVVSGGHSSLYLIKDFSSFKLIGSTRDDAAGEAFDKVARLLKLGYPGGPIIDKLAQKGKKTNLHFPQAQLGNSLDFSFSGVKTSVLYYLRENHPPSLQNLRLGASADSIVGRDESGVAEPGRNSAKTGHNEPKRSLEDVAFAFQSSVVEALVRKSIEACKKYKVKTLLVGGGVAANSFLRNQLNTSAGAHKIKLSFPPLDFCLDNAAMIAGFGYHHLKRKTRV